MSQITCGCTCHELDPNDSNIVILNEKQWHPICALKESVRLLSDTTEKLNKLKIEVQKLKVVEQNYELLLSNIQNISCPDCNKVIGMNWAFAKNSIICISCMEKLHPHYF